MPKATHSPTTPPQPAPLPSILDFGRTRAALLREADQIAERLDAAARHPRGIALEQALELAYDRDDALIDLIATLPATTIGDAAAQLCVAWREISYIDSFDLPKADLEAHHAKLRRMILSVLPVVAEAAGLDLAEITDDWIMDHRATEFPDLGVVS